MTNIKLCDSNNCTFCTACNSTCNHNAITFQQDQFGFSYPYIDTQKCIECGNCIKVCPILSPLQYGEETSSVYALYSRDCENVQKSSSGGVFYELAQYIIAQGGYVLGVVSEDGIFSHTLTKDIEGLEAMRGSKYVQSEMGDNFREVKNILTKGNKVLFTGTPCQVAGLKSYLRKDYSNLITCEVICHGVPSQRIFNRCMDLIGIEKTDRVYVSFRDMKVWNYVTSVVALTGRKHHVFWENDIYMKLFMRKYTYKEICYNCPFASLPRVADLTIGDFWGIKDTNEFRHNDRGTSVLLVNTLKGKEIFSEIAGQFIYALKTIDEAVQNNPNIKHPTPRPIGRDAVLHDIFIVERKQELIEKYRLNLTLRNMMGYIYRRIKAYYVH